MKKMVNFFAFVVLSLCSLAQAPSESKPEVNINVTKEYDDNGNVIRYDSTYSYSYSGSDMSQLDSLYQKFYLNMGINPGSFSSSNPFMNSPFMNDPFFGNMGSPFGNDPFFKDFFEMDSIMLQFIDPFGDMLQPGASQPSGKNQDDGFMF